MAKKRKLEGRIRYEENWNDQGEHYVFELKWSDEKEWGLDIAAPLIVGPDSKDDTGDLIHYTALTKIREWQTLEVDFYFE